jgi:hypothetical protein
MQIQPGIEGFMKKALFCLMLLFVCRLAQAADGFEGVRCGADISKALVGQHMSNEPVVAIEGRHKDLGLKDLGASDVSDNLSAVSWQICGNEFMLLEDSKSFVKDVLAFPAHSKSAPGFSGSCQTKGEKIPGVMVGVLVGSADKGDLPAKSVWKVDEKVAKFVPMPAEGLVCSRDGIFTADGGN